MAATAMKYWLFSYSPNDSKLGVNLLVFVVSNSLNEDY